MIILFDSCACHNRTPLACVLTHPLLGLTTQQTRSFTFHAFHLAVRAAPARRLSGVSLVRAASCRYRCTSTAAYCLSVRYILSAFLHFTTVCLHLSISFFFTATFPFSVCSLISHACTCLPSFTEQVTSFLPLFRTTRGSTTSACSPLLRILELRHTFALSLRYHWNVTRGCRISVMRLLRWNTISSRWATSPAPHSGGKFPRCAFCAP